MDQKTGIRYAYAPNHSTPAISGVLVAAMQNPPYIALHLYNEYPDVPPDLTPETPVSDIEGLAETNVSTVVREIQSTLVIPFDVAVVISKALNHNLAKIVGNIDQSGDTEDDS